MSRLNSTANATLAAPAPGPAPTNSIDATRQKAPVRIRPSIAEPTPPYLDAAAKFWYFCRIETATFDQEFFRQVQDAGALGLLFDYLPDVYLFVKDRDHRFTMVNQALWRLHGCQRAADMLGKTDWDFHYPVLARQYVDEDKLVMRIGKPIEDQVWLVPGADGLPRWYISTKIPLRDRNEQVVGIAGVMRPYEQAGRSPGKFKRLAPALEYVFKNFGEPIEIATLAERAHLSVSQFQREFKRLFRIAPRDYLFEVRLQTARRLLTTTSDPLGRIAMDCGFYDQSYFVKRFKAATGLRPLEYRRRFHA